MNFLKPPLKSVKLKRVLNLIKSLPRHFVITYIDYNGPEKHNCIHFSIFFIEISIIVSSLRTSLVYWCVSYNENV